MRQSRDKVERSLILDRIEEGEVFLRYHGRVGNIGKGAFAQTVLGQVFADPGQQLVVEGFIRAVAVMGFTQDGDVMFHTQHADHELFEIGAMVLAVAVSDLEGVFRKQLVIFTPEANRGGIPMTATGIEIEDDSGPSGYLAEDFACADFGYSIKYPADVMIAKNGDRHRFTQHHLDILIFKEPLQVIQWRTPGEGILNHARDDQAGFDRHLSPNHMVDKLNQSEPLHVGTDNGEKVDLMDVKPACLFQ